MRVMPREDGAGVGVLEALHPQSGPHHAGREPRRAGPDGRRHRPLCRRGTARRRPDARSGDDP
ncbi:hypothetical protein ACFPRL_10655 [Pseudoclavibacter helvolus]